MITTAMEDAIHAWVVAGSGLVASKVVWDIQNAPRVAPTYISMIAKVVDSSGEQIQRVYDAGGPAGAEITYHAREDVEIDLQLQCYGTTDLGASGAASILANVRAKSKLVTIVRGALRDLFNTAKLSFGAFEPITKLAPIVGAGVEPRAIIHCKLFATTEVTDTGTFVETIGIDGASGGDLEDISILGSS